MQEPSINKDFEKMYVAIRANKVQSVKELLKENINLEAVDPHSGFTALHTAALRGNSEIMALLLEKKMDPNASDRAGYTPLHAAVDALHITTKDMRNQAATIKKLLQAGAERNTQITPDILHKAVISNNPFAIRELLIFEPTSKELAFIITTLEELKHKGFDKNSRDLAKEAMIKSIVDNSIEEAKVYVNTTASEKTAMDIAHDKKEYAEQAARKWSNVNNPAYANLSAAMIQQLNEQHNNYIEIAQMLDLTNEQSLANVRAMIIQRINELLSQKQEKPQIN